MRPSLSSTPKLPHTLSFQDMGSQVKKFYSFGVKLMAQLVKNLPAMQEAPVRFLGQKDPLEKGQATHSSIHGLPWWLNW